MDLQKFDPLSTRRSDGRRRRRESPKPPAALPFARRPLKSLKTGKNGFPKISPALRPGRGGRLVKSWGGRASAYGISATVHSTCASLNRRADKVRCHRPPDARIGRRSFRRRGRLAARLFTSGQKNTRRGRPAGVFGFKRHTHLAFRQPSTWSRLSEPQSGERRIRCRSG